MEKCGSSRPLVMTWRAEETEAKVVIWCLSLVGQAGDGASIGRELVPSVTESGSGAFGR